MRTEIENRRNIIKCMDVGWWKGQPFGFSSDRLSNNQIYVTCTRESICTYIFKSNFNCFHLKFILIFVFRYVSLENWLSGATSLVQASHIHSFSDGNLPYMPVCPSVGLLVGRLVSVREHFNNCENQSFYFTYYCSDIKQ